VLLSDATRHGGLVIDALMLVAKDRSGPERRVGAIEAYRAAIVVATR